MGAPVTVPLLSGQQGRALSCDHRPGPRHGRTPFSALTSSPRGPLAPLRPCALSPVAVSAGWNRPGRTAGAGAQGAAPRPRFWALGSDAGSSVVGRQNHTGFCLLLLFIFFFFFLTILGYRKAAKVPAPRPRRRPHQAPPAPAARGAGLGAARPTRPQSSERRPPSLRSGTTQDPRDARPPGPSVPSARDGSWTPRELAACSTRVSARSVESHAFFPKGGIFHVRLRNSQCDWFISAVPRQAASAAWAGRCGGRAGSGCL